MSDLQKIDQFVNLFCSNASGVLSTITNQNLTFKQVSATTFDFGQITTNIQMPSVVVSINFNGEQSFQLPFIASKDAVAALADLMMLGDGEAVYSPEEHNDAIQEMINQVLGSLSAELSGENVSLTGTVVEVELTDMEIQRDFMQDNVMVPVFFELLGKNHSMFLVLDAMADDAVSKIVNKINGGSSPEPRYNQANQAPKQENVSVSRASFSEFGDSRPAQGHKPQNIDMLMDIVLPVTVELGKKEMRIKEILELGQGSVVELDKLAGDLVDLMVNGKKFAIGEVMVADENYAVRIVSLVSREDRIRSLGK